MANMMSDGRAALSFLEKNYLEPTPENYRLAYLYVTESDPGIVSKIDDFATNDMRLTQEEADRIAKRLSNRGQNEQSQHMLRQQERETARVVASIVEAAMVTTRTTRDFGRDLAQEGHALNENPTAEQLESSLRRIIDRTNQAERELNTASQDIAKLRQELEQTKRKADTDELTGLCNRRAMQNILDSLDRKGDAYCIAMIDIDHFKAINDDYGHEVGDRTLQHVARCISEALPDCEVARWGGEEFLVLAQDPLDRFAKLVEQARATLEKTRLPMRAADKPMRAITFSAGISPKSENSDSTIRIADLRAYDAKRAGRNTVVVDAG